MASFTRMNLQTVWGLSLLSCLAIGDSCVDAPRGCKDGRYRSLNGSCNNLNHPSWGMPYTRYGRLAPAKYGDGVSTIPLSKSGRPLPGPRELSFSLYPEVNVSDKFLTLNTMQFGQFISHDLSLTVLIPDNDPEYSIANITCMALLRTTTDFDKGCKNTSTQPVEQVTAYLDLSLIYGNSEDIHNQIRKFQGGLLLSEERESQQWPINSKNRQSDCPFAAKNDVCYFGTDARFNQNPQLIALEVLFYREHNRIARKLSEINPHWDDEELFQEARKISIGSYQNIVYYEWLPVLFDKEILVSYGIIHEDPMYFDDYDVTADPSVLNEFSNAAYRHFHTAVAGYLNLTSEDRSVKHSLRMSDWYQRSDCLEISENSFDDLVRGLNTQHQMEFDRYHDKEVSLYLFRGSQALGRDVLSIDIQRSRDHGLASYNDMREYCGLKKAINFRDFNDTLSKNYISLLESFYEQPDDVDLYVGGSLETHPPGSLVGHTFKCILLKQFHLSRTSDRYWFERSREFTVAQLSEVRKATMSKIVCDNSKDIRSMQKNAFVAPKSGKDLLPCSELPAVDLEMWRESSPASTSSTQ